ncbi:MAG: pilus assembly protein [Roseinatronobacter sp.]|nr:MAG: pilus assembly protein [Roseinatronobacter sp.]
MPQETHIVVTWCINAGRFLCAAPAACGRFLRNTSGATAVLFAILFPVLVLGMGLGTEAGYQYMSQRKLQHAADVAAHAAGARLRAGDEKVDIDAAALHVAIQSGYLGGAGDIVVNIPPKSGQFTDDENSVEVILPLTQPRYFSALVSSDPVNMRGRAVARITESGSVACILALSRNSPRAITVSGSTSVALEGCDIASNSSAPDALYMSGNGATLDVNCAYVVGEANTTAGLNTVCEEVQTFAPVVRDPYADLVEPSAEGACQDSNQGSNNSATTITAVETHPSGVKSMRFCSGLNLRGDVTFAPGLYIIEGGDFTVNNGTVTSTDENILDGEGVTFYLAPNARIRLASNSTLNFAAPTTGPFAGIAFFGSRSATGVTHRMNGTSGSSLQGALYMPASEVEFSGNTKLTTGCTQVIGYKVTFTGNSDLRSDCSNLGTRQIKTKEVVRVVE